MKLMDEHRSLDYSASDIVSAFNLRKGHHFAEGRKGSITSALNRLGQVVFAEGKVGTIIEGDGNHCKISYSDGSKNLSLTFYPPPHWHNDKRPVEDVYAMME